MFDLDLWQEIMSAVRKNKLRTFLTGFSVAWGIFMLIVLLSAGNGLKNGVMSQFSSRAVNTVEVWGGRISMPHNGLPRGRRVQFDEKDLSLVETQFPNAANFGADLWTNATISYGGEYASCAIRGIYPVLQMIDDLDVPAGRFINEMDLHQKRKVVIIGKQVQTTLFKDKDPLGKYIKISNAMFRVVGIFERNQNWGNDNQVFIPFSTHQMIYANNFGRYGLNSLQFTISGLNSREDNEQFNNDLRKKLSLKHRFHPDDKRAVGIWNQMEDYLQTMSIFNGISLFMWIIGIGTLAAGVVGVSNIMLITVRERTREFGIRKALGAKPLSILQLILLESITITALFGYVGMVAGIAISEAVNKLMGSGDGSIFKNPTVDLSIALLSTLVLIIAGMLAGYFPARKAIKITAVEAMRTE
jgi:putative ABC transport system permease protein